MGDNENVVVPSRLDFWIVPRFPIQNAHLSTQPERIAIISESQAEMNSTIAARKLLTSSNKNKTPTTDLVNEIGEDFSVYDEESEQCKVPYILLFPLHGTLLFDHQMELTY